MIKINSVGVDTSSSMLIRARAVTERREKIYYAVQSYLDKLTKDDVVVMLFGDSGRAYLSKDYY